VRIFKSSWFVRFAKKKRITDAKLCEAIENAEKGLIDADYGDGLIKQRIARPGEGKSGGYRQSSCSGRASGRFSSTALRQATGTRSTRAMNVISRNWPPSC